MAGLGADFLSSLTLRVSEDLKRRLAEQSGHDREAHTDGKGEFVANVLSKT
jgi:hypothetical protein